MCTVNNIAVILSGGSGNRFIKKSPKQFAEVGGRTILSYCIDNFIEHKLIDELVIVSNPAYIEHTNHIAENYKSSKSISVIPGGKSRGESSFLGLDYIVNKYGNHSSINVLIHDAARPNTGAGIVSEIIKELDKSSAVSVVVPSTDTVYISENNKIKSIPDRKTLVKAQTPQAFKLDLIYNAYLKTEPQKRFAFTDDCSVLHYANQSIDISLISGSSDNIKITYDSDVELFVQLLKNR